MNKKLYYSLRTIIILLSVNKWKIITFYSYQNVIIFFGVDEWQIVALYTKKKLLYFGVNKLQKCPFIHSKI